MEKKVVCQMELPSKNTFGCSQIGEPTEAEQVENYSPDEIKRAVEIFQMLIKWRDEELSNEN